MSKKKSILYIGGSFLQLPGIRWAKKLGLSVALTDINLDNPGRELADIYSPISGDDLPALISFSEKVAEDYQLVGAYCSNDFGLKAVAEIAEIFKLPGPSVISVSNSLDKTIAREIWGKGGLPIPNGIVIEDLDSSIHVVDEIGFPVIVKPVDSSGSRGVSSALCYEELWVAYEGAKKYSAQVLVEELIEGKHIDVNGLLIDGKFYGFGTMERHFSEPPYHYPLWGHEPTSLDLSDDNICYEIVDKAASQLGIKNGPVKADLIYSKYGPILIELAPRFHGDVSTSYVSSLVGEYNPISAWFKYLLDGTIPEKKIPAVKNKYGGYMAIFPPECGMLKSISDIDEAKRINGVNEIFLRKGPGRAVIKHVDNTSIYGFIWATGDTVEKLHNTLLDARNSIKFNIDA